MWLDATGADFCRDVVPLKAPTYFLNNFGIFHIVMGSVFTMFSLQIDFKSLVDGDHNVCHTLSVKLAP